jgi:hypothetical protein
MLGLLLMTLGSLWGMYYWYISIAYGLIATTGTVMLAALPIILGFQLLLQAIVLDIHNVPTVPIQTSQKANKLKITMKVPEKGTLSLVDKGEYFSERDPAGLFIGQ